MTDALESLREIGSVAELRRLAATMEPAVLANNAHVHLPPNFSAFTTMQQAVDLADAQDCRIVGAANYYDYQVYSDFAAAARRKNVLPLFGLEIICMIEDLRAGVGGGIKINDPGNPGKMYICGKGIVRFEKMTAEAQRILGTIRRNDATRIGTMVERLSRVLAERGLPNRVTVETVTDMVVRRHGVARETVYLQERHVAQAVQEYIFARVPAAERVNRMTTLLGAVPKMKSPEDFVGAQNDIRSHLMKAGKPGFVEETFIDFATAVGLIRELGGFVCYPVLADGANPICPFETPVEKLIAELKERRIFAAELITGRNSVVMVEAYAKALRAAGMVVTCGTEHNTLDLIPMVPVCADGPVPGDIRGIFYEGACVVAGHQFVVAQGERGFEGEGIEEWARLGNAVIRQYLKGTKRSA
jgi:hypothetical protein